MIKCFSFFLSSFAFSRCLINIFLDQFCHFIPIEMSDASRPGSRWSNSMSAATKTTAYTNQTIPLTSIRRKLLQHSANNQRTYAQRLAKSKRDIEELFKLYYSNDIKFDTIHRQIVMGNSNCCLSLSLCHVGFFSGTRIPNARTAPASSNDLTSGSSTNMFSSKHCVSREQMNNTDLDGKYTLEKSIFV